MLSQEPEKLMVHSRLILVLLLLAGDPGQLLAGAADELRTWSDVSGRFTVTASLVACEDGQARLRKPDGRVVDVPLERLSETDRQWDNPHPERDVEAIEYRSMMSGETAPFCVGMTVASDPASADPAATQ